MKKDMILGIDPGLKGAIAFWVVGSRAVDTFYIPTEKSELTGKHHILPRELAFMIDLYKNRIAFAVVEDPNSMPTDGVTSAFRFGHACGIVQGILAALSIKTMLIKPSVWKARMGLSASKDLSRLRASEVFTQSKKSFTLKKSDGLAEAALLAKFGERFLKFT